MPVIDDFILLALVAGIALSLAAGPLGCFIVWRRMAYFGDATAHAAVFGVAVALLLETPIFLGVLLSACGMALLVSLKHGSRLANDTLLGVAAHASLAFGLVVASLVPGRRVDLEAFLFGDILSLDETDVGVIALGSLAVLGILVLRWRPLLTATLNEDLASAEGLTTGTDRLLLAGMLAVLVAVAIKIVGALLITAMLIIPAACARTLARTPEWMAVLASLFSIVGVIGGLQVSIVFDTPAGPSIVAVVATLFLGLSVLRPFR